MNVLGLAPPDWCYAAPLGLRMVRGKVLCCGLNCYLCLWVVPGRGPSLAFGVRMLGDADAGTRSLTVAALLLACRWMWGRLPRRAALAAADVFEGELPAAPVVVGLYGVGDVEGGLAVEGWL